MKEFIAVIAAIIFVIGIIIFYTWAITSTTDCRASCRQHEGYISGDRMVTGELAGECICYKGDLLREIK